MSPNQITNGLIIVSLLLANLLSAAPVLSLESGWQNPPNEARLRAYWWWINGNVTKAAITHDLEQMKAKGFGGALICDANGASQDGNDDVPHGPTFFSPEWRELYKHALREADRLGLEMSLNIQSGWNLGGPFVTPDDAGKKYIWSELRVAAGTNDVFKLPQPKARDGFYRDTAVIAFRLKAISKHAPLQNWKQKALQESLRPFSSPESTPLFQEMVATSGEEDCAAADVLDLTKNVSVDGTLRWEVPAGDWQVLRFGYTIGDHSFVSTSSEGWSGYSIDVYSATAFQTYWDKVVAPLIADAGPLAGKALKYLHTDSWEIELANWTPTLCAEFKKRQGYEMLPWLPVLAGRIIESREASNRFLHDYRKTLGDLAIDNHYRLFRDYAHKHGLMLHPESGGPHAVPIDAQRCLGWDDAPMSEFWAWSWTHRIGDENRFFVKQPASAAHTYGRKLVLAEGFTTIGPHWQEKIWDNLKPTFDKALCEGLNLLVWHAFVCSPDEMGVPGQQYFAGTHLNPKVTWWEKSSPFFSYINRCQWLMQQGNSVADVAYYYGDHVPNFARLKKSDPAKILPGYDYDVITAEALLERAAVRDGRIVLPDGVSYHLLALPERAVISLPVLKKLKALVAAGATIVGPQPERGETLANFPATDSEIAVLSEQLWSGKVPGGRVFANKSPREVLQADGVPQDFNFASSNGGQLDYVHRATAEVDIYFVANRSTNAMLANCDFRVANRVPELWNAVTGEHRPAKNFTQTKGVTRVPLELPPCGSWFVVFRNAAPQSSVLVGNNITQLKPIQEINGAWTVHFDPKWGGPETVEFDSLVSWPIRPEAGIKFYSGTAVYEKSFDLLNSRFENQKSKVILDLGSVRELAEVRLNGQSCGIVWCPPWQVDVTAALKPGANLLKIEVVNFWPNRIIGDANQPKELRLTRTNIRKFTAKTPLEPAGLLGPVTLQSSE
jgi:hypothetical protein